MTEKIDITDEENRFTFFSHALLEFSKTTEIEKLTEDPDWDIKKANVTITVNGIEVSVFSFNQICEKIFEHFNNEIAKPEENRIKEKALELLKNKLGNIITKVNDIDQALDFLMNKLLE